MTRVAQRPPAILHPTTGTVAMFEHRLQRLTVLFPLTVAILLAGQAAAADGPLVRFLTDDVANPEYWLTQTQPEEPALERPQPAISPIAAAAARRRRSSYRLPNMFGDSFANGTLQGEFSDRFEVNNIPSAGGVVGRVKIADNNSPIPRDRLIFNYNFFNNVTGGIGDVNRYALGFEHTFLNQSSSVQVIVPLASTLDAAQVVGSRATDTRFGDLGIVLKTILLESDNCVIAGGVGLTAPTSEGTEVFAPFGELLMDLKNESVHILPYLAFVRSHESGLYWQGFLQFDFDAGRKIVKEDALGNNQLRFAGELQDQALMFVDLGVGYWLTDTIAATAEVHYLTTLEDADLIATPDLLLRHRANRLDVVNLTFGANILVCDALTVRPAMVVPVAGKDDDQFDYEAMVQMNFWR